MGGWLLVRLTGFESDGRLSDYMSEAGLDTVLCGWLAGWFGWWIGWLVLSVTGG